jgi:hypothetical protein
MSSLKWFLQIRRTKWVYWGYGKKRTVVHMEPSLIDLGHGMTLPFKLPSKGLSGTGGKPTEYARRVGIGWRWQHSNGSGHAWNPVSSIDNAIQKARASLEHMRVDTREIFTRALEDIRIEGL